MIPDIIGLVGMSLVLLMYYLLQFDKIKSTSLGYSVGNLFGSIFLLVSLYYHWNLATVILEIVWLSISIYGIWKFLKTNKREKSVK